MYNNITIEYLFLFGCSVDGHRPGQPDHGARRRQRPNHDPAPNSATTRAGRQDSDVRDHGETAPEQRHVYLPAGKARYHRHRLHCHRSAVVITKCTFAQAKFNSSSFPGERVAIKGLPETLPGNTVQVQMKHPQTFQLQGLNIDPSKLTVVQVGSMNYGLDAFGQKFALHSRLGTP